MVGDHLDLAIIMRTARQLYNATVEVANDNDDNDNEDVVHVLPEATRVAVSKLANQTMAVFLASEGTQV